MSWEWALQENQAEVAWLCLLPSGLQSHKITSTVFYQPRQPPLTTQIQEKRNPAAISAWKDINSFAGSTCLVAMPTGCVGQTERKLPTVFLYKGIGIQGGHSRASANCPRAQIWKWGHSRRASLSELPWTCGSDPILGSNTACIQPYKGTAHSGQSPASAQPPEHTFKSYGLDLKSPPKARWLKVTSLPTRGIWGNWCDL